MLKVMGLGTGNWELTELELGGAPSNAAIPVEDHKTCTNGIVPHMGFCLGPTPHPSSFQVWSFLTFLSTAAVSRSRSLSPGS